MQESRPAREVACLCPLVGMLAPEVHARLRPSQRRPGMARQRNGISISSRKPIPSLTSRRRTRP